LTIEKQPKNNKTHVRMLEIGPGLRSENCAKTIKYKKETEGEKVLLLMG
jgi:hypothetical protein